jgi:hypothetical protein
MKLETSIANLNLINLKSSIKREWESYYGTNRVDSRMSRLSIHGKNLPGTEDTHE